MVVVVMRRRRLLVAVVLFSHMKALESGGGVYIWLFAYDSTALAQKGDLTKREKATSRAPLVSCVSALAFVRVHS